MQEMGFDPRIGKFPWRREWQLTPVFLLGEPCGQWSLAATVHKIAKSWTRLSGRACTQLKYRVSFNYKSQQKAKA